MRTKIALGLSVTAVALGTALAQPAFANGFSLQDHDAKALGMANAFAATADNPSAVYFNPAGMSQLDGLQGSAMMGYIQGYSHFKGENAAEGEANARNLPIVFPAFFGTYEVNDQVHIGIGTFVPYGLAIEWPHDWSGRYVVTEGELQITETNPNVSFKQTIAEGASIAVAAGFGIVRSAIRLERAVDLSALGAPDGYFRVFGDTDDRLNFTWNVAVLLSLFDRKLRIGGTYRAPIDNIRIRGTAEFDVPAAAGIPSSTRAFARVDLPDEFRGGIAVQPIDPLTLEFDFTWRNWTKVDKIFIELDDIGRVSILDFGLNDSWFFALGANYKLIPDLLQLRAGVYWDETPVRLETRNPALPDANRKGFSFGIGVTPIPSLSVDVGYLTVFFDTARKHNEIGFDGVAGGTPRGNGDYDTFAHVIALTVGLKF